MNKRRVAVHEAGHALGAYIQGGDLYSATIEPTEEYGAQVESETPNGPVSYFSHDDAHDLLRTLYDGGEAERLVFGDGQLNASDRQGIIDVGVSHAPVNDEGVRDSEVFANEAFEILQKHREALKALAEYLLDEETLREEEIQAFLDERIE